MQIFVSSPDAALDPVIHNGENTSIIVFLSHVKHPFKRNFRCVNCGVILFEYVDEIRAIIDSYDLPKDSASTEIVCKRCKLRYKIV